MSAKILCDRGHWGGRWFRARQPLTSPYLVFRWLNISCLALFFIFLHCWSFQSIPFGVLFQFWQLDVEMIIPIICWKFEPFIDQRKICYFSLFPLKPLLRHNGSYYNAGLILNPLSPNNEGQTNGQCFSFKIKI